MSEDAQTELRNVATLALAGRLDFPCMFIFLFSGGLVATASSTSRNEAGDCQTSICKEDKALLLFLELAPCYILFVIVSQSFDHCQSLLLPVLRSRTFWGGSGSADPCL